MTASASDPDLLRGYLDWARQHIGGSEDEVRAAAQALMQAKAAGYSAPQAIAAAKEAGRRARAGARRANPAPSGKIAGIARGVRQSTQFGTMFQTLDFELDRADGPPVRVQIRGNLINGRIDDGDEIIVDRPQNESRFIQADRVFNRTSNSYVEAPKGAQSLFAHTEEAFGKDVARVHRGITIGVVIWVAAIFLLVVGGFIFASCEFSQGPTAPTSWCEQAKKAGVENPPGC